ncbi:MAG: hypothetical protein KKA65_00140 [Nanoarchaeota archaeon]|nr:hypothetical protein [Nanoarchaeota archaeon]MBU4242375.1 hypothetical protein [Nanoarchaeota archaeon]MBU4352119.1 hypothetical protein [Nanoarchaeota archaeon]MBU4455895.1 hypothetical protein [Nanoarchaeota archaeon]MCG2720232.1 hypothetical protein [Nanoarchaeota archaeon]
MAKPQKNSKKEAPKKENQNAELLKNMPPEMQEKMKALKAKLDNFTKKIVEKFEAYIMGVALLPPEQPKTEEEKKNFDPEKINALVLIDDSDSKKMSKEELHAKITHIVKNIAKEIDGKLNIEVMLGSELKESCYDGKEEILQMIAMAAPVYDPSDMLAAIKISEVHKRMVIKKFEKYIISYVAAGSLFRGEKSNDIDVYVIIDDTDVKKMARAELKDKLRAIIIGMGMEASKITGVKKQFHVQTYILTDFWDNIKDANPVIFTLLRDGVPLYDRGVFMPWKLLLQMGRIKPSPEAIDMGLDIGEKLVQRAKQKLLSVLGEDLYYAVLNPAQAALMLYGIPPPTPKETIKLLNDIFVKKEKLLEKKYVDILEKIRTAYKNIEHGKVTEVTGKEIDDLLKGAEDYLKRIKELFKQIEERTEKESILDVYDTCLRITRDLLAEKGIDKVPDAKLDALFKEKLIEEEKIPAKFLRILKDIEKAKKDFEMGKLSKQEVNKVKKDARLFIKVLVEHMQRKKSLELERTKVRFKYGKKVGELIILEDLAFIVKDLEDRDEMLKADITKEGGLDNIKPSSLEELEKHISKIRITKKAFVRERLFEDLRTLVGEDVEILLG